MTGVFVGASIIAHGLYIAQAFVYVVLRSQIVTFIWKYCWFRWYYI